jgi:hypothetical protein
MYKELLKDRYTPGERAAYFEEFCVVLDELPAIARTPEEVVRDAKAFYLHSKPSLPQRPREWQSTRSTATTAPIFSYVDERLVSMASRPERSRHLKSAAANVISNATKDDSNVNANYETPSETYIQSDFRSAIQHTQVRRTQAYEDTVQSRTNRAVTSAATADDDITVASKAKTAQQSGGSRRRLRKRRPLHHVLLIRHG